MPEPIMRFSGPHRFLSNFYPAPVRWEGILYPSTEAAFNAGKTLNVAERLRIAAAPNPAAAKRIGRHVKLRPDWDRSVRYRVMAEVLELKFTDPELRGKLVDTGTAELIEGNDWHDTHWGVCVCRNHCGYGENYLGMMLMKLRARLRHLPAAPSPSGRQS